MKKALVLLLTLALAITSFTTVSFASDITFGLDVLGLGEQIIPNEEFDVILYTTSQISTIYSYQLGINYDKEYFELKNISSSVANSYKGIEKIDNANGKADFAYYIGNKPLTENSDSGKYKIALLTFKTLKAVDKALTIEIDDARTTLLNENAAEIIYDVQDLNIVIPATPYKTAPTTSYFTPGSYLKLATSTKDADIYYTTNADEVPNNKMNGSIRLPNRSTTYYAIAKKYGISSARAAFQLSFRNTAGGGGVGGGGGGGSYGGSGNYGGGSSFVPQTNATVNNTTNTNTNTATQEKYADIKGHWAESYVKDLINKKIINGYEDGTIKPANTVTRAEVAKIIVCALGQSEAKNITLDFADAGSIADWAKGYIQTAVNLGILNGYEDNTFKPTQPVTRQELAKIAMVAFKMGESQNALTFADKDTIPAWSAGYISSAVANGIITGYEDNTFKPTGNVTRAEICTIVSKCLK